MKYYLIPKDMAVEIAVTTFRYGGEKGYVVFTGDLCNYGIKRALDGGAVEISAKEAKEYIEQLNK